jgi:hypothetical protein
MSEDSKGGNPMKKGKETWFLVAIILVAFFSAIDMPEVEATAPRVYTLSATNVTATSATLKASVNPSNKSTEAWFQSCDAASSASYFAPTSHQSIGHGSSGVSVEANLTGLRSFTTYSYVAYARNSDSTSYGDCMSFTTTAGIILSVVPLTSVPATSAPLPPKVTTLSATDITQTSAKLRANVNPEGRPTTVDFCSCDFTSSPSFFHCKSATTQTGTGTREVSVILSGLEAGRTYRYVAQAQNAAGNRSGLCVSFGTSPAMTVMTVMPLGIKPNVATLDPTNVTATSATLRGTVNANNLETGYTFVSCNAVGDPAYFLPSPPQSIGSGPKTFTVTYDLLNLTAGRVYSYKIQATNSAGTSTGSCVTFLTPATIGPTLLPMTIIPTTIPPITVIPTVIPPTYLPPTIVPTVPPTSYPTSSPGTLSPQNQPPHADAGPNQSANLGEIVTFNGSSSSDPDGNILTYLWDFGDGQTGSGANAMHTYNRAGQYAASLTVSDGQYSDTAYVQVVVNEKSGFSLGGTTALYIGLGVIALLLLVLIIVMLTRKQPPRIYSSR